MLSEAYEYACESICEWMPAEGLTWLTEEAAAACKRPVCSGQGLLK